MSSGGCPDATVQSLEVRALYSSFRYRMSPRLGKFRDAEIPDPLSDRGRTRRRASAASVPVTSKAGTGAIAIPIMASVAVKGWMPVDRFDARATGIAAMRKAPPDLARSALNAVPDATIIIDASSVIRRGDAERGRRGSRSAGASMQ
jgi:hypothetical protein